MPSPSMVPLRRLAHRSGNRSGLAWSHWDLTEAGGGIRWRSAAFEELASLQQRRIRGLRKRCARILERLSDTSASNLTEPSCRIRWRAAALEERASFQ